MEGNVTITKNEYLHLRKSEEELNRLEAGGIDNWEWYGESLNPDGQVSLDERETKLKTEIEKM